MGQYVENVSMFGADLTDNEQAAKYRKAFVEFPPEILSKAKCEMYDIFLKHFKIDQYMASDMESRDPLRRLRAMQELLISVVNRFVHGCEGMQKVINANINLCPANLNEIRKLELTLKRQIKIFD